MNKVLVIAAHPDDEVLGCGATIAKHTQDKDKVRVIFVSDGFASRNGGSGRESAAEKALEVLGCERPIFLNFIDNQLDTVPLLEVVKELEKNIDEFQPNIVYTHHFGDLNIDHQFTHRAVMTACRPQPNFCVKEIYSFEVLSSTYWQSISMGNSFNPNYFVEISKFMSKKVEAIQCYDLEMRQYPHARSIEMVKNLAKYRGGLAGLLAAEAFCVERLAK